MRAMALGRLATAAALAAALAPVGVDARPYTLAGVRARAEQVGPPVELALRRAEVADAEIAVSATLPNPTLTLLTARQTARLGAGVSLPLPVLGQRGHAIAAARADAAAVRAEAALGRLDARWGATGAWIDLWLAHERARLLLGAADDAARLLSTARELFEAGKAPRVDVVRATAERARAAAESLAAHAVIAAAAARLPPWLAEGADAAPEPAGPLQPPETVPPLADLLAAAARHPQLERDQAQQAATLAHLDLERRLRLPVPNAELTINAADPTLPGTDVIAGLSFEAPVLSRRDGTIERARRQRALAEATTAVDERLLLSEVRDAYHGLLATSGRARALRAEVLPAILEARQMTEEGYREGRADLLRVLEAQRVVVETRLAVAEAVGAWAHAAADLERAAKVDLYAR